MTKLLAMTTALALMGTAAIAGPFGLPDHERDGYRDTGCPVETQVQILNDAGEYLYSNNPGCPGVGSSGFSFSGLSSFADEDPVEETPDGDDAAS